MVTDLSVGSRHRLIADHVFVCLDQDGRLCCSYVIRCGDAGRAVGYDGLVAGAASATGGDSPTPVPGTAAVAQLARPAVLPATSSTPSPAAAGATTIRQDAPVPAYIPPQAPRVDNTSAVSAQEVVLVSELAARADSVEELSSSSGPDNRTQTDDAGREAG